MAQNESQTECIRKAMDGDQAALAELFEQYRGRLRRMVVLRMDARIRARFDASDVVQEAFVDVAKKLPNFAENSGVPFFLWLRMVTGDRLDQFHRRHLGTKKRCVHREVGQGGQIPGASSFYLASQLAGKFTSVDRRMKCEEVRQKLEDAVNNMDINDREIIAMRHFEELSTNEIAIVLGMTRSGVLKRYTRAIRKLGNTLKNRTDFSLE